jgi:hypothetical protein
MVESRPDLWWPLHLIPQVDGAAWAENFTNPTAQWVQVAGRLESGASAEPTADSSGVRV